MRLGVDYYPEHWDRGRWATDARLMREAGLSVVRIGEFAWALLEPAAGRFDWSLFDGALGVLASEGLQVIIGTPTAAPPAWLAADNPDVLPVRADGRHGLVRRAAALLPVQQRLPRRLPPDRRGGSGPLRRAPGGDRLADRQRTGQRRDGALLL